MLGKQPRLANWVARNFARRDAQSSVNPAVEQALAYETRGQNEAALDIWRSLEESPHRAEAIRRLELRVAVDDGNSGRWTSAVHRLVQLWKADPSNAEIQRELELAAECGAREAQTDQLWDEASAQWFVCRTLCADDHPRLQTLDRSLHQCALKGARAAEAEGRWEQAMQAWETLRTIDPDSDAASKGVDRAAHNFISELGTRAALPAHVFHLDDPIGLLPQVWQVEVLSQMGRAHEASHRLFEIETAYGQTALTRYHRAQICINLGRYAKAAEAAMESIALSNGDQKSARHISDCLHLATEAMCALDQHAEARKLLMQHLRGRETFSDRDIQAVFSTARTKADLEEARKSLAPAFVPTAKGCFGALKQYSVALRDLGYTDEAIQMARQRLLDGLSAKTFGQSPRGRHNGWSNMAKLALLDLKTDLDAGGFEFFLTGGTLLGCIRENDILKHDRDIDIGVMPGPSTAEVASQLRSTGHFRLKPVPSTRLLRVLHANGTSIDLFWHWMEDGKFVHQGQKTKWWNTPFTLISQPFLGSSFKVPANAELCLSENYANWQEPARDFDTFVDTPNMTVSDKGHLIWYFYSRLYDYYVWGESLQFTKVWRALRALTEIDTDVTAKVSRVMEAVEQVNSGEFVGA